MWPRATEVAFCKAESEPLSDTKYAGILMLGFSEPRIMHKLYMMVSDSVWGNW